MIEIFNISVLFQQVLIAMAIGGLIGLEREKEEDKFAGLRTMALLCGTGPLVVYLSSILEESLIAIVYLTVVAFIAFAIIFIRFSIEGERVGFTTSVTVLLVAILGLFVGVGYYFEATAIAIITAFLLAEKELLTNYASILTYKELSDTMKLGMLVFILYPILPTDPIDPYGIIRLREVLLFAILVLLIEFSSYISMRQFGGSKGLHITGILAGGANSFATAAVMAKMAKQSPNAIHAASSALILASVSMIVRNVAIASILALSILYVIWIPAAIMVGCAIILAYILNFRNSQHTSFNIEMESPFSFKAATKFAGIYILITMLSVVGQEQFGNLGLFATAFGGGMISSAAVAVSAATILNEGAISVEIATGMVIIGIIASLTSKLVLLEFINSKMRTKAGLPIVGVAVAGILAYLIL